MASEQPRRRPGRPATGRTPHRTIRVGQLWTDAQAIAEQRGESMTDVIVRALTEYVQQHTK